MKTCLGFLLALAVLVTTGCTAGQVLTDEKAIYDAVEAGDIDTVRATLDVHPEWVHSTAHRWQVPPLHIAAYEGHKEIVVLLIERGADVNAYNERWKWRPIHEAAGRGHAEIVRLLLDNGAKIDVRNHEGLTPMAMAAGGGHTEMVALLLERGASVNEKLEGGWTLLHVAAASGKEKMVASLIERGADVLAGCDDGRTPLHWARTVEVATTLLDHKADVAARGTAARTPLHLAAFFGKADVATVLLERGAEVNATDNAGRTPLELASAEHHSGTVTLLKSHGGKAGTAKAGPTRAATVTKVGPRGQFIVNGKPMIPFGVWQQPPRLFAYHRALGASCMVWPPSGGSTNRSSTPRYVKEAEKQGLGAFVHYNDNLVAMKGTWGWVGGGWPMEKALRLYERLRRVAPDRIIQCNFGGHDLVKGENTEFYLEAFRYVDCVVPHVWPKMFEDEPRSLRHVATMVDNIRTLCKDRPGGEISIWADINPHEWRKRGREKLYAAPTPEEFEFQVWVALIHGADGICLFTISFEPFVYSQIPASMEEFLPRCIARVQRFALMLCAEESPRKIVVTSTTEGGIVDFTTRRHEGSDYIFLLNGTAEKQTVRLEVDGLGSKLVLQDAQAGKPIATPSGTYEEQLDGLALRIWELVPVK